MATNEAWIRTKLATSKPCFGHVDIAFELYESNTCTGIFAIILLPHSCCYEHTLRFKTIPLPQGDTRRSSGIRRNGPSSG